MQDPEHHDGARDTRWRDDRMTGRRSHGRLSALNGVVHQGMSCIRVAHVPVPRRPTPAGAEDTSSRDSLVIVIRCAQRRPERQPRLHDSAQERADLSRPRSTKAGASTPATPGDYTQQALSAIAQRRPERQPRLHEQHRRQHGLWGARSTKAGASTPGYTARRPGSPRGCGALNEGRSVNPGYTLIPTVAIRSINGAQRRPERQPRLHERGRDGDRRRHQRSTKAGASTPATLLG